MIEVEEQRKTSYHFGQNSNVMFGEKEWGGMELIFVLFHFMFYMVMIFIINMLISL